MWKYLSDAGIRLPREGEVNPSDRPRTLAHAIKESKNPDYLVTEIMEQHQNMLVADEYFRWIDKDDNRLIVWLFQKVQSLVVSPIHSMVSWSVFTLPSEKRRDEIILIIDTWNEIIDKKQQFLNDKKAEWGRVRTPERETKWLKLKDADQLTWAWEYLHKQFKIQPIPAPVTAREYYDAVLATLDKMSYEHPAEKKLFIDKMKKTWGQKKYRDSGKAKKPYILPLTRTAHEKLEWLAKHSNTKTTDVLERLIAESYEKDNINSKTLTARGL